MAAVFVSGLLSVVMARAIRSEFLAASPRPLEIGILFALSGFLLGNGLFQARFVQYPPGKLIAPGKAFLEQSEHLYAFIAIFLTGLILTLVVRARPFRFQGSPIIGILGATAVATYFGVTSGLDREVSFEKAVSTFGGLLDWDDGLRFFDFAVAVLVIFVIDFFGGVGKLIGLFNLLGISLDVFKKEERDKPENVQYQRTLEADGYANMVGSVFGASSLAIFISSAAGIKSGARTEWASYFTAGFMLLSLPVILLVGAIPIQATSGILVYIAFLIVPWKTLLSRKSRQEIFGMSGIDLFVSIFIALVAFVSFSLDISLALLFSYYSLHVLKSKPKKQPYVFYLITFALVVAVSVPRIMAI